MLLAAPTTFIGMQCLTRARGNGARCLVADRWWVRASSASNPSLARLLVTAILDQSKSTSVVAQRTASREAVIERERLRAEWEEEIKQIQAEIG